MVRTKMSREERAKQFMPFAALKGYPEALQEKEKIIVPKAELSEEYQEEINRRLIQIKKNDIISLVYYCKGEYLHINGAVSGIDPISGVIEMDHTEIKFNDIYKIYCEKH